MKSFCICFLRNGQYLNERGNNMSDSVRISREEADRLTGIIAAAIDKAVKPIGLDRLVFDGTTYFFMLPQKMAQTTSPDKNTNCQTL